MELSDVRVGMKVSISASPRYPNRYPYWIGAMDKYKGKEAVVVGMRVSVVDLKVDGVHVGFVFSARWLEPVK